MKREKASQNQLVFVQKEKGRPDTDSKWKLNYAGCELPSLFLRGDLGASERGGITTHNRGIYPDFEQTQLQSSPLLTLSIHLYQSKDLSALKCSIFNASLAHSQCNLWLQGKALRVAFLPTPTSTLLNTERSNGWATAQPSMTQPHGCSAANNDY